MDGWKSVPTLPNPFEFMDGSTVETTEDWEKRRVELASLAQRYVFGRVLQPESLSYKVETMKSHWLPARNTDGKGNADGETICDPAISCLATDPVDSYRLVITMNQGVREASFDATVYIPAQGADTEVEGPYPVLTVIGKIIESQRLELRKSGYAVIEMAPNPIYSDDASQSGAYTTLFPYKAGELDFDSGALMAWAWGVSRIVDALHLGAFPEVNPAETMVTGVSRYGKAALLAGAFDPRIAITIPVDTGQAGTSSFRYNVEGRIYNYAGNPFPDGMGRSEKISNMVGHLSHWFSSQISQFTNHEDWLPFDAHSIMSLVAPRPLLVFAGEEFDWLCQPSTVLSYQGAKEVYEFLGADDAIALNVRKGAHAIQDRDIPIIIDLANHVFRKADIKLDKETFPHVDAYHEFPYVPDSSYVPWSRPEKHVLWTDAEQIVAGIPNTVTAYSDADTVTLQPPSSWFASTLPNTVPVQNGKAIFHLAAEQAKEGRYVLSANGSKISRTVEFLGTPWDDAFKTAFTGNETSWIIHFADRYDKEEVRVLVNDVDVTDPQNPARFFDGAHPHVYLMNYGICIRNVKGLTKGESEAYRIEVKHLRFRNVFPAKTFRYSYTAYAANRDPFENRRILFTSGADTGFALDE